jgi:hypothetical protein
VTKGNTLEATHCLPSNFGDCEASLHVTNTNALRTIPVNNILSTVINDVSAGTKFANAVEDSSLFTVVSTIVTVVSISISPLIDVASKGLNPVDKSPFVSSSRMEAKETFFEVDDNVLQCILTKDKIHLNAMRSGVEIVFIPGRRKKGLIV